MKYYKFKIKLTDSERYRVTILTIFLSGILQKSYKLFLIPLIMVLAISFVFLGLGGDAGSAFGAVGPVLIVPASILFLFVILPFITIKLTKYREILYEFDDWGMKLTGPKRTLRFPWQDIPEFRETKNFILFRQYNSTLFAHLIRKADFENYDAYLEFIDLLREQKVKRR